MSARSALAFLFVLTVAVVTTILLVQDNNDNSEEPVNCADWPPRCDEALQAALDESYSDEAHEEALMRSTFCSIFFQQFSSHLDVLEGEVLRLEDQVSIGFFDVFEEAALGAYQQWTDIWSQYTTATSTLYEEWETRSQENELFRWPVPPQGCRERLGLVRRGTQEPCGLVETGCVFTWDSLRWVVPTYVQDLYSRIEEVESRATVVDRELRRATLRAIRKLTQDWRNLTYSEFWVDADGRATSSRPASIPSRRMVFHKSRAQQTGSLEMSGKWVRDGWGEGLQSRV